jgi:hypothetical protein
MLYDCVLIVIEAVQKGSYMKLINFVLAASIMVAVISGSPLSFAMRSI